jgi:hypothetical protein
MMGISIQTRTIWRTPEPHKRITKRLLITFARYRPSQAPCKSMAAGQAMRANLQNIFAPVRSRSSPRRSLSFANANFSLYRADHTSVPAPVLTTHPAQSFHVEMRWRRNLRRLMLAIFAVLCLGTLGIGFFGSNLLKVRWAGSVSELDVHSLSVRTRHYALFVCYKESTRDYFLPRRDSGHPRWVYVSMRSRLFGITGNSIPGTRALRLVGLASGLAYQGEDRESLRARVTDVLSRIQEDKIDTPEIDAMLSELSGDQRRA